ncbi:hypothetical protein DY124_05600 [Apilactobacillus micheneri]|uniref:Uncharacterized protein n=1 Tax=Apilactobacillus micheneri TaxID=1899430 RepID=A0A9Q8IML5_9LACO|nr:hypothetical protein DY121_03655 [Apilactobacillus micheneri]TPR41755.1 hypothetical protein DY123_04285 [Apilactobacillus micheneri]TPR43359.1 hypothetical protein DY124_05600 [Apilactobacillus micheneri]TPR44144.1 hypothetical protein DY130_03650 [Apilactobacillus micheneri]TPR45768.1 hypothetical protein DY128_03650 [Apilactobacillus micheneri]
MSNFYNLGDVYVYYDANMIPSIRDERNNCLIFLDTDYEEVILKIQLVGQNLVFKSTESVNIIRQVDGNYKIINTEE